MKIPELKALLEKHNIRPSGYTLYPNKYGHNECDIVIAKENGMWKVFGQERYEEFNVTFHATEEEACAQFLRMGYPELANSQ
ncbi:MAG: hypothetical protein LBT21_04335 [Oscillospiraceae bacterium]|jgi:hypothetical protein|nr:hypothetical protein [Oscillospiraceae bacterium]